MELERRSPRGVPLDEVEAAPMIVIGHEVGNDRGRWRGATILEDLVSDSPALATVKTTPLIGAFEHEVGYSSANPCSHYTHLVGVALRLATNLQAMQAGAEHFVESLREPNSGYPEGRFLYMWADRGDTPIPETELREFESILPLYFRSFPPLLRGASGLLESSPLDAEHALQCFGGWIITHFVHDMGARAYGVWHMTGDRPFDRSVYEEISAIGPQCAVEAPGLPKAFLVW